MPCVVCLWFFKRAFLTVYRHTTVCVAGGEASERKWLDINDDTKNVPPFLGGGRGKYCILLSPRHFAIFSYCPIERSNKREKIGQRGPSSVLSIDLDLLWLTHVLLFSNRQIVARTILETLRVVTDDAADVDAVLNVMNKLADDVGKTTFYSFLKL